MSRLIASLYMIASVGLLFAPVMASEASATTFIVNSTGDRPDQVPLSGTCDTGFTVIINLLPRPECTFRAAIQEANSTTGQDVIQFSASIATSGGFVRLTPATPYPTITQIVVIDGRTAPGFNASDPDATPVVQISGTSLASGSGLAFGSLLVGGEVYSIAIHGFPGNGISVAGSHNLVFQGLHVGVRDGNSFPGNQLNGIALFSAENIQIGQTCGLAGCTGRGNLISGNGNNGIFLFDSHLAKIGGNRVGTNRLGTAVTVPPLFASTRNDEWGVRLSFSGENEVGIVQDFGFLQMAAGNLVSGNGLGGVLIDHTLTSCTPPNSCTGNLVQANRIGTNAAGTAALGNIGPGVEVLTSANVIGGTGQRGNLISGNEGAGLSFDSPGTEGPTVGNQALGNSVGVDVSRRSTLGNTKWGIVIWTGGGRELVIDGNTIGGNAFDGISESYQFVDGPETGITNNWVGTNEFGDDLGNGSNGIQVATASVGGIGNGNTVGFNGGVGIRANGAQGIGSAYEGPRIIGNWIGTNAAGDDLGNGEDGIYVIGHLDTKIGGLLQAGNTIGFNALNGIRVHNSEGTVVENNLIGVTPAGDPAPNGGAGIELDRSNNTTIGGAVDEIEGFLELRGNIIANHFADPLVSAGVRVLPESEGNSIRGNDLFENSIGIDLGGDGVTVNDATDADDGPNQLQNSPQIDANQSMYDSATNQLSIRYRVTSSPVFSEYPLRIDFYRTDAGATPGETLIGSDVYEAVDALLYKTHVGPPGAPIAGPFEVRAVATDALGNSSEGSVPPLVVPESGLGLGLCVGAIFSCLLQRSRSRLQNESRCGQ